jgi:hypothetical protein
MIDAVERAARDMPVQRRSRYLLDRGWHQAGAGDWVAPGPDYAVFPMSAAIRMGLRDEMAMSPHPPPGTMIA